MIEENKTYRAVIEGYSSDGAGIARIDGVVVFVKGAIRDELTDIVIEHVGHSAAWGRAVRVCKKSMARKVPDCPYYGICGGCQFRQGAGGQAHPGGGRPEPHRRGEFACFDHLGRGQHPALPQ